MKKVITLLFVVTQFLTGLVSCKKEDFSTEAPSKPTTPVNPRPTDPMPNTPAATFMIKVKATIEVGEIMYDSIPASLQVTSWDSTNTAHQKQIELNPGANVLELPKAHVRYQLKLSKWGVTDEMTFTKDQINEGTLIGLGGKKAARKLKLTEKFLWVEGAYRPNGKSVYQYTANGNLQQVDYFQKLPQFSELQLTVRDKYEYSGNLLNKVNRYDGTGAFTGFTAFIYNAQGTQIVNIHEKTYDRDTYASVSYSYPTGAGVINIDYLFSNGQAMEYEMTFKGGNKVQDVARSSTGAGEGGTYVYDFNINPFAHLNMPTLNLSNLSKNNLVGQQKGFSGSIPSAVPYEYTYSYDSEGYPKEVVTSYKSGGSGEYLYKVKTVFHY
ncbi:MAG TPA: hypothetical protein VD794_06935 [Flavisolibacter sp.]|nr:hypothetical protein [Flavisolibacter sp.]